MTLGRLQTNTGEKPENRGNIIVENKSNLLTLRFTTKFTNSENVLV